MNLCRGHDSPELRIGGQGVGVLELSGPRSIYGLANKGGAGPIQSARSGSSLTK